MKKNKIEWTLAIVPFLIIIIGLLMLGRQTLHYTVSSDPEYFYLLNGLNIAQFKITSGNYIHPGIPLQYLSGIIIGVDYLISGKQADIVTDVMLRSEHYINTLNGTIIFLTGIIFFIGGLYIYKYTKSIAASIFLQSVVLLDQTGFFQLTLLVPEKLVLPIMFTIIVLMIRFIQIGLTRKQEFYLVSVLGFMIAVSFMEKLTMLPMAIVPLFIFRGSRNWKIYLISLVISTLIFFIPIIEHIKKMNEYFSGMAMHSGLYGGGEKKIVDINSIVPNLQALFREHLVAMYSYLILIVSLLLTLFKKFNSSPKSLRIKRVMIAFALAETLMLLMLLKHFKPHYFAPVVALSLFNFYLVFEYIRESQLIINKRIHSTIYAVLTVVLLAFSFPSINSLFKMYDIQKSYEGQLIQVNNQYKNMPKIILPRYYGTPFEEFSIYQAIYYSNNYRQFGAVAKKLWPSSYFYTSEWGVYDLAYSNFKLKEVLEKHKNFLVSYYDDDQQVLKNFYDNLRDVGQLENYSFKKVYYNELSNMVILEMNKEAIVSDSVVQVFQLNCDMEPTTSNLANPAYLSSQKCETDLFSLSGNYSVKLDESNEFGTGLNLNELHIGDIIVASAWRLRNGNLSSLVISATDPQEYYTTGDEVVEAKDFWDKIEMQVQVPGNLKTNELKVYLWQNDKNSSVFFDDFSVKIYRKNKNPDSIQIR